MGCPKQVLPYGSTTLVGAVVVAAQTSTVDEVVVVTGFHGAEVAAAVRDSARIVENPNPAAGNMSSLVTGLNAVGEGRGLVVLLSDMPDVSTEIIDALIAGVDDSGADAGWVAYRDGSGHPIVLAERILREVRDLTGSKALWRYLTSLGPDQRFVLQINDSKPIDVNTTNDYEKVIRGHRHPEPGQR